MSSKQIRNVMRIAHIIEGTLIAIFIYSATLRADPTYTALIQFVITPLIILSGVVMWQLPRINKWRSARRREMAAEGS
jgi:thiosulfate reductase cytochrome b subunit